MDEPPADAFARYLADVEKTLPERYRRRDWRRPPNWRPLFVTALLLLAILLIAAMSCIPAPQ